MPNSFDEALTQLRKGMLHVDTFDFNLPSSPGEVEKVDCHLFHHRDNGYGMVAVSWRPDEVWVRQPPPPSIFRRRRQYSNKFKSTLQRLLPSEVKVISDGDLFYSLRIGDTVAPLPRAWESKESRDNHWGPFAPFLVIRKVGGAWQFAGDIPPPNLRLKLNRPEVSRYRKAAKEFCEYAEVIAPLLQMDMREATGLFLEHADESVTAPTKFASTPLVWSQRKREYVPFSPGSVYYDGWGALLEKVILDPEHTLRPVLAYWAFYTGVSEHHACTVYRASHIYADIWDAVRPLRWL